MVFPASPGSTGAARQGTAPVLSRLKNETRPQHEAIENALDLMSEGLTTEGYRYRLERLYGFYRPVEQRIFNLDGWPATLDLQARCKTPLLEADLRALGIASPSELPLCQDLPDLRDLPRAFGCLYVMEGATLGGQFITRHIRRVLGIEAQNGGRFFQSYGDAVGARWKGFRAALGAYASPANEDEVVRGAAETFEKLHRWYTGEGRE
ncbi:biliverdin-producing heme oxygenase [Polyangium aurulentum]|nr:biliverdin-producing heme oxygenase [Polyangium aurulentum]UQA62556.1 biliverdin-producing heme oxygenase [Polyangium aurulentum]